MITITILAGIALIVIGVAFYVGTNYESVTALIPAFVGIAMLLCGAFAFKPNLRSHMMHLALVLSVLVIIAFGHRAWTTVMSDGSASALAAMLLSIFVCLAHVVLGVRSFLAARHKRKAEHAGQEKA